MLQALLEHHPNILKASPIPARSSLQSFRLADSLLRSSKGEVEAKRQSRQFWPVASWFSGVSKTMFGLE
jgi:hypothetical protein